MTPSFIRDSGPKSIMTKNSIFVVSRGPEFTISVCARYFHLVLHFGSERSQEILKNLSKALEKYLEMCRKTDTALVLKLDIDFVTL